MSKPRALSPVEGLRKRLAAAEQAEEKRKRVVALKAELKGLTARKPKK